MRTDGHTDGYTDGMTYGQTDTEGDYTALLESQLTSVDAIPAGRAISDSIRVMVHNKKSQSCLLHATHLLVRGDNQKQVKVLSNYLK